MLQKPLAFLASGLLLTQRGTIALLHRLLFQPWKPDRSIQNLVIYRVGNLGDTVLALPALAAIRQHYPKDNITLLTSPGSATHISAEAVLASFETLVDRTVSYIPSEIKSPQGLQKLKQALGPVDGFIDLPVSMQTFGRNLQELFFAKFIGAPVTSGFGMIFPPVFKKPYCREYPDHIPQTHQWLVSQLPWPAEGAAPILKKDVLAHEIKTPFIAINPGAKLLLKQWPKSYFIQTIKKLATERPELNFVLLGSPAESILTQSIVEACPGLPIQNLCGEISIAETFQLLPKASAVLTNDTGLLHIAGITGVPIVAPVSGQYPDGLWNPPASHEHTHVLRHPVPCAPCFRDHCPYSNEPCLTTIKSDAVVSAILASL